MRHRGITNFATVPVLRVRGLSRRHRTPTAGFTGNAEHLAPRIIDFANAQVACCKPQSLSRANETNVIHSRSQEAQVYADFCQPLRALDSTLTFQPIPANMLSASELTHAIRTTNADIIAMIRGGGAEEQFSVFENPELLCAWSEKRAYRIAGIGHSGNSTSLDFVSDFSATTPAAAGAHIADALRRRRDSQQQIAQLRTQNDELRMRLHHVQIHETAQPPTFTPPSPHEATPAQTQHGPTALNVVFALLIGMIAGAILLLWFMHRR